MPASPTAGPDVAAAFAELAETLASDLDIDSYLTATCRHCLRLIPVESAAIVYATGADGSALAVAASDPRSRALALGAPADCATPRAADNPWADCMSSGQLMTIADLTGKRDRWPWFAAAAVRAGVTSATIIPVSSHRATNGALALLGGTAPDVAGILLALSLADAAAAGITLSEAHQRQQTAISQLQNALTSRVLIEQAKGVLAERWKVSPDQAFGELLRRLAGSDTLVVATADHGFLDSGPDESLALENSPGLPALLRFPLCGERRVAFCHVQEGREREFAARAADWLGDKADVRPSRELAEEGWFGPGTAHPRLAERIGDVAVVGIHHVTDQRRQVQGVGAGVVGVAGDSLASREGAQ